MKQTITALAIGLYALSATPVSNHQSEKPYPYSLLGTPGYSTPSEYRAKILRGESRMRRVEDFQSARETSIHYQQRRRTEEIDLRYESRTRSLILRHDQGQHYLDEQYSP